MRNRHIYSEDDIRYIKFHYKIETVTELARHCGVSFHAMENELKRLGLVSSRDGKRWSEADITTFRDLILNDKTLAELVAETGRTERAILEKARQLGLKIKDVATKWKAEEMDYLRRNWGRVGLATICEHLGRTESAVIARAFVLKLPPCYLQSEDIPLSEFGRDTGISSVRIRKTLAPKFDFPLKYKKPNKKRYYGYVDIEKILLWLESHQSMYSAAKIPLFYFGEEPDWLIKKRKADSHLESETVDTKWKADHWSTEDFQKLKDMVGAGRSQAEIAKELGRTKGAVRGKLAREGLSHSSPKFWRGRDFKALQDGIENKSDDELATELGRSKSSIIHHRTELGLSRMTAIREGIKEAESYILEHWLTQSDEEIGSNLGRSVSNIKTIRLGLGLRRGTNQYGKPTIPDSNQ